MSKSKSNSKIIGNKTKVELTISQHLRELHDFVNHVMAYAEEPANWPMTQQEQIYFVKTVVLQARRLRRSEGYMIASIQMAAEELAMAS